MLFCRCSKIFGAYTSPFRKAYATIRMRLTHNSNQFYIIVFLMTKVFDLSP